MLVTRIQNMSTLFNKYVSRKARVSWAIFGVGILASVLVVVAAPANTPIEIEEKSWPVSIIEVAPGTLSPNITLYGRVQTPNVAQLTAAVSANVLALHVKEGQTVAKGALLVSLDSRDAGLEVVQRRADISDAKATLSSIRAQHLTDKRVLQHQQQLLKLVQKKFDRYLTLHKGNLVSTSQLDDGRREAQQQAIVLETQQVKVTNYPNRLATAEARVARTEALLEQAQLNFQRTKIVAPFDGRIIRVSVAPGNRVVVGAAIAGIYDVSSLEVRASIPSQYLGQLKLALDSHTFIGGIINFSDLPKDGVRLELVQLAAQVVEGRSGVDGMFRILSDSLPVNHSLELGRVVNLQLTLPPRHNVIAVPVQSVYDNRRVYRVVDGRLEAVEVEIVGERTSERGEYQVLVRAPELTLGSRVITTQLPKAISGLKVSPILWGREAAASEVQLAGKG